MTNLNYSLSKIYNNLFIFFKHKQLISLDEQINDSDFIKEIFNNEYFIIKTVSNTYTDEEKLNIKNNILNSKYNNSNNYQVIYYIIFHYKSDIYLKTQELKKILIKLKNTSISYKIVLISKTPVSTHVQTFINSVKSKMNIINYTYKLFTIIIPNHILSNKHEILNNDDAEHLLKNILLCKKHNLPKIKINDPQIIWTPGKINDVVKITRYDDITGLSIYYRVIIES
jgi:DNA-directed RNA polymerase subunit H (RpoH/RPB5)